jgi:hypothetical protein
MDGDAGWLVGALLVCLLVVAVYVEWDLASGD